MLSPLFDNQEFLFDEGWDMTMFHREAAAFTDMEFWADIEAEAAGLSMVAPVDADRGADPDWAVPSDEEHKDKLVHHDCMWAGSCADSAHPGNTFVGGEVRTAAAGQSLLRRAASPPRPDTPPSLDDEEQEPPEFRHAVDVAGTALRLLRDSAAVAADHSYTLAKPTTKHRFDSLGVQTPSDSEEEIDVVSISEKSGQTGVSTRTDSLPRVPSALDRHNIQRTVASAITSRRAPVTPPRKRMPSAASPAASVASYSPARKRTRGPGRRPRRSSPDTDSDPDVPDMEKRSLHNDMERMRRIGLKNLFDQLKEQIPATRDKERAPKVVILREAASLCRRLQAEERERETLRRHQTRLLAKLKKLRSIHAAARSHAHPVHGVHHAALAPAPAVWAH